MNNQNKKNKKKKGFTLIELIIVLGVMAIIGAIAIPSLNGVRENAKVKADERSCDTISRAITVLVADGTIPENAGGTITITSGSVAANVTSTGVVDNTKIKTAVENALGNIEAPQYKGKKDAAKPIDRFQVTLTNGVPNTITTTAP